MSDDADDPDLLAAEYVLGALAPEQMRALEALALHDPAIARSIADWQDRLGPLSMAVPGVAPPPVLWRRLALATGIDSVIASRSAPPHHNRIWRSPGFWRATTVAALAIAASLFFMLRPVPNARPLIAALAPSGAPAPGFLVRVAPDGRGVIVAAGQAAPPTGRSFELWALPPGGTAPISLGVLPPTGARELTVPNQAGTQLMVSQEPFGGSTTGKPTGPVLFAGTLTGA